MAGGKLLVPLPERKKLVCFWLGAKTNFAQGEKTIAPPPPPCIIWSAPNICFGSRGRSHITMSTAVKMAEKANKACFFCSLVTESLATTLQWQSTHLEKHLSHLKVLELHQSDDTDEGKELRNVHDLLSPKPVLLLPLFVFFPNTGCWTGCYSLFQDSDPVTFFNIHDLTRSLYSTWHAPSKKKRDFGDLIGGGWAGSRDQNTRKLWASLFVLASRDARAGPDLVKMVSFTSVPLVQERRRPTGCSSRECSVFDHMGLAM